MLLEIHFQKRRYIQISIFGSVIFKFFKRFYGIFTSVLLIYGEMLMLQLVFGVNEIILVNISFTAHYVMFILKFSTIFL